MDVGMLWFDNDKKANLQVKVARAVSYYQKKYGQAPNLCFVHPSMLSGAQNGSAAHKKKKGVRTKGVEIRPSKSLLPNHFWLGVEEGNARG